MTRRAQIGPAEPEMAGGRTCSTGLVLMQQAGLEPGKPEIDRTCSTGLVLMQQAGLEPEPEAGS